MMIKAARDLDLARMRNMRMLRRNSFLSKRIQVGKHSDIGDSPEFIRESMGVYRLTVTLKDVLQTQQYTIVGSQEADPGRKRISNESPVGKAVLGQKPGTVVTVTVPAGTFQYEIVSIDHV